MRRSRLLILLGALLAISYAAPTGATLVPPGTTWSTLFPGTRATSMGTADVAGSRRADAVLLNAAPLGTERKLDFSGDHQEFFNDGYLQNGAAAGTFGAWRVTVASSGMTLKDTVIPSAPDTADYKERTFLGNVAYDLGPALSLADGASLVLGAGFRSFDAKRNDWRTSGASMDLGLTMAATVASAGSRREMVFALTTQNLLDVELGGDAEGATLPRRTLLGATLNWDHLDKTDGTERFTITGAAAYEFNNRWEDGWKVGMEFTLARVVALRWGHNQALDDGTFSWGAGLILDRLTGDSVDLALEWGRIRYGPTEDTQEDMNLYGVRAGFDF